MYLYEEELIEFISEDLRWLISLLIMTICIYMLITWVGNLFVAAELPRQGHEKLLNGLKEGILILEEDSSIIKFYNQAARRLITEYSDKFSITVIDERNVFEKEKEMFAFVDKTEIFDDNTNCDYYEVKKKIKSIDKYISINEIIAKGLLIEGVKQVFKLKLDFSG